MSLTKLHCLILVVLVSTATFTILHMKNAIYLRWLLNQAGGIIAGTSQVLLWDQRAAGSGAVGRFTSANGNKVTCVEASGAVLLAGGTDKKLCQWDLRCAPPPPPPPPPPQTPSVLHAKPPGSTCPIKSIVTVRQEEQLTRTSTHAI